MNRQVPETQHPGPIAIIGNGKVARHMIRYFESVGQPYTHWFRQQSGASSAHSSIKPSKLARCKTKLTAVFGNRAKNTLATTITNADTVLLLIADDQIEPFIHTNPIIKHKTLVHFSGSLHTEHALGCHPLMTFADTEYTLEQYQAIPFVVDEGVVFKQLFPLLNNPVYHLKAAHKAHYHALCVMAGNFTQMLWQGIASELQSIDLPSTVMTPYLLQNTINYTENPKQSATGPLVRGDYQTISKHQAALSDHPLGTIYQAFYAWHQQQSGADQPEPQQPKPNFPRSQS